MKKSLLFAIAVAIGFAGLAQTSLARKDEKPPVKTEKKLPVKKESKKVAGKKTDAKASDLKAK
jgi:hypothetical protein